MRSVRQAHEARLAHLYDAQRRLAELAGCAQILQTRQAAQRRWDGAAELVAAEPAVGRSAGACAQSAKHTERAWLISTTPGVALHGWRAAHRFCRLVRLPSVAGMVPLSWLLSRTLWKANQRLYDAWCRLAGLAGCAQTLHSSVDAGWNGVRVPAAI